MLKPETEKVWRFLQEQPALAGFILLGGSALALHLRHRYSEDLDFAYPAERLPRAKFDALLRVAAAAGFDLQAHDDPVTAAEFASGGLDLLDYHEAFLMAGQTDQVAVGLQRLCSGTPSAGDERFEPLLPDAPDVEETAQFFRNQRDLFERSEAVRAWREGHESA